MRCLRHSMKNKPGYYPAKITTRQEYEKRMRQVSNYVFDHLDEQIDLNRLADVACMSPYHWHRVYQGMHGETLASTVKRLRLQRAADMLANTSISIDMIARRAGYSGVPAFNRAFKQAYGSTPVHYRDVGSHTKFRAENADGSTSDFKVDIVQMGANELVAMPHTGSYMKIDRAFTLLFAELASANVVATSVRMFGVYFDDPDLVADDRLEALAGAANTGLSSVSSFFEKYTLQPGVCAVLRHQGPYADMHAAYSWLFGRWLVSSGFEADDRPVFEEYLNNPRDTPPTELLVDIHLPLRCAMAQNLTLSQ